MARKRGGLAGLYDRNKGVIKTLAPIAAGFIPGVGPALGAAIGAAIGGDREGKGYFKGFNAMGAAKGGLSGYGGAKLGQAAKGKLSGMFTGQSPLDKLTGAPKMGLMTQTTGPSSYGAMGSYQPTLAGAASMSPTAAAASAAYPGVGFSGIGGPVEGVGSFAGKAANVPPDITDIGSKYVTPMNQPLQMKPTDMMGAGNIPYTTEPSGSKFNLGTIGGLFGKEGMIEQNKTLLSGIGKGVMGTRSAALEAQTAEENRLQREAELAQRKYEFDKTYGIDAAQEADRKRREDQLQAQRAAFRAMFTGGVG